MRIAAIIPTLDEASRILATVDAIRAAAIDEIVVVDGGSRDATVAIARAAGATVVTSAPGRARQQNVGAGASRAPALVFVHADVIVPPDAGSWIRRTLIRPGVAAGAFRTRTRFDGPGGAPRPARWLRLADVRSRLGRTPYGDQAIFVGRETFEAVGGFPEQPLLEDLELSRRLRRRGAMPVVPSEVVVSGRRFVARPVHATLCCHLIPLLYGLGVSAPVLARLWGVVR
jgi:rSAM/selenodomain-associated transferase 2